MSKTDPTATDNPFAPLAVAHFREWLRWQTPEELAERMTTYSRASRTTGAVSPSRRLPKSSVWARSRKKRQPTEKRRGAIVCAIAKLCRLCHNGWVEMRYHPNHATADEAREVSEDVAWLLAHRAELWR